MCGRAVTDHHARPARVQVELLALADNGEEGKSKMIALCGFLGERVASIQWRRRSGLG